MEYLFNLVCANILEHGSSTPRDRDVLFTLYELSGDICDSAYDMEQYVAGQALLAKTALDGI